MAITYLAGQDPALAKADQWVREHIERDFKVEELCAAVALSPRTFARRIAAACGVSPIKFVQRIRLEVARKLLETTRLPLEQIAHQVVRRALGAATIDPACYEPFTGTFPPAGLTRQSHASQPLRDRVSDVVFDGINYSTWQRQVRFQNLR